MGVNTRALLLVTTKDRVYQASRKKEEGRKLMVALVDRLFGQLYSSLKIMQCADIPVALFC